MKTIKKVIVAGALTVAIAAMSVTVYAAANYATPAEAVAGLTGRTVDSVVAERQETGKTYGQIASEAGKLDEFKAETLEMKRDYLNELVAAGKMTQEEADAILAEIEANQAICDGTGNGIGAGAGMRIGSRGAGQGNGGTGRGMGRGAGAGCGGQRSCDGSCLR